MMLRCDNVAPFGRPVVPLVNRMMKGSSSSSGVSGSGASPRASTNFRNSSHSTMGTSITAPASAMRARRGSSPISTFGWVSSTPYASSGPGPPAVQAGDDRAAHDAGPDRERVLDGVRARDRHAVALAHAVFVGEHRGVRRDATGKLPVGDDLVAEDEIRRVGVPLGGVEQDLAHVRAAAARTPAACSPSTSSSTSSNGAPGPHSMLRTSSESSSSSRHRIVSRVGAAAMPSARRRHERRRVVVADLLDVVGGEPGTLEVRRRTTAARRDPRCAASRIP